MLPYTIVYNTHTKSKGWEGDVIHFSAPGGQPGADAETRSDCDSEGQGKRCLKIKHRTHPGGQGNQREDGAEVQAERLRRLDIFKGGHSD